MTKIFMICMLGLSMASFISACKKGTGEKVGEKIDEEIQKSKDIAKDIKEDVNKKR